MVALWWRPPHQTDSPASRDMKMTRDFILPDRLDSSAAPALLAALRDRIGKPLVLDAGRVEVIGALAFGVLVAAGRQWEADGHSLTIRRASERFAAASRALGLCSDAPWRGASISCPEKKEQAE